MTSGDQLRASKWGPNSTQTTWASDLTGVILYELYQIFYQKFKKSFLQRSHEPFRMHSCNFLINFVSKTLHLLIKMYAFLRVLRCIRPYKWCVNMKKIWYFVSSLWKVSLLCLNLHFDCVFNQKHWQMWIQQSFYFTCQVVGSLDFGPSAAQYVAPWKPCIGRTCKYSITEPHI